MPNKMVCAYKEFLALWAAAEGPAAAPTGLVNLGNRSATACSMQIATLTS